MVRREIKRFELIYGDTRLECGVPCSVKSALAAASCETDPKELDKVCFETDIYADEAAIAMKNFYLRLRGISMPARIYIGEEKIATTDGKTPVYNIDLSGKLSVGNNRLSIRFTSTMCGDLTYAGISQPAEIIRFSGAIVDRVFLSQKHSEAGVSLGIKLDLIGDPTAVRAVATLVSSSGQIYYAGLTAGEGSIQINDPLFWWPRGLGVQNLYRLTVNLWGENDVEDSLTLRIGLRTVSVGENGALTVNGITALPMGSVFIPEADPDFITADDRVSACVTSAAMAGYTALLIPCGAPRPTEKFYDLCDVHGIMVIEEYASITPADADSLHNRGHHASLCLIDLIGSADPTRDVAALGEKLPDLSVNICEDKPEYLGLPSLPSMKTIAAAIPEDERSLFSHSVEAIAEEGAIKEMLMSVADRYPYPHDLSAFSYASALASAHKVGEAIKESRLSGGLSGRPMFYRLRDTEMVISPSAIDCRGRWKPMQYYASHHFAPLTVYADLVGGRVYFSASSQRRTDCIGSLEYRIADASNYTIFTDSIPVEITALTHGEIHSADLTQYISGHERDYYLEFYIKEGSSVISKTTMLFVPEKHFNFKKPKMKVVISGQERRYSITLSADCFVKDMEISFDGVDVVLEDNYFDLTSEAPVKINFTVIGGIETSYHLKDVLQLRSVYDLK